MRCFSPQNDSDKGADKTACELPMNLALLLGISVQHVSDGKDGIYLEDFPRYVKRVQLFPGSRAQLLLNCPAGEEQVISSAVPDAITGSFDVALGPDGAPLELFTIRSAGASLPAPSLTPWSPPFRPASHFLRIRLVRFFCKAFC